MSNTVPMNLRWREDRFGDRDAGELRQHLGGFAGVEMVGEVIDGLVGGFEEAERLGLERQRHGAAGALLELDQVRTPPA